MPPLPEEAADRLREFLAEVEQLATTFVGYPCSQDYDYPELRPFLRYALNNVGDPFGESIYRENTFSLRARGRGVFPKASPGRGRRYLGIHDRRRHRG